MFKNLKAQIQKQTSKIIEEENPEASEIYHLRMDSNNPSVDIALCNQKSSGHWRKYSFENFSRGTRFSSVMGTEMKITGRRCAKCLMLLNKYLRSRNQEMLVVS